jgi:hypothetical protein
METHPAKIPVFERGLWCRGWFIALLCVVFVELDWELVPLAVFPFVFVFPVMLAAWNRSLRFALACALLLSLSRVAQQFFFASRPATIDDVSATLVRFFVLALLATLTYRLGQQARQLRHHVRQLEGILPICTGCKSIRDREGNWLPLEGYITTHSPAQVSNSFCPDCFKDYFGEVLPARGADSK